MDVRGNIWVIQGTSFFSKAIMKATGGNVSHVALQIDRDNLVEALVDSGVVVSPVDNYFDDIYCVVKVKDSFFKNSTTKETVLRDIVDKAKALVGTQYHKLLIFAFFWRALFRTFRLHKLPPIRKWLEGKRTMVVCSQLVDIAYDPLEKIIGRDLFRGDFFNGLDNYITPYDILKSKDVEFVCGYKQLFIDAQNARKNKEESNG